MDERSEPRREPWWHKHGLGITLGLIFATITATTIIVGYQEYASEQADHGQPPGDGFWLWWTFEYSMSLVADVFGAILLVVLTKRLREIGSAESK